MSEQQQQWVVTVSSVVVANETTLRIYLERGSVWVEETLVSSRAPVAQKMSSSIGSVRFPLV